MSTKQTRVLFILTPALHPNEGGVQMSTWKLGTHFVALGHDVSVFSFAHTGHSSPEPMRLFHPDSPGGHHQSENLRQLETTLTQVQPHVVINQMPYEHAISKVLDQERRFLLLGCLRNTLYSVRGNLENYVSAVLPEPFKPLAKLKLLQQLLLKVHRRRHRADLLRILETYDYFVMFGPPNLEELAWFVPEFDRETIKLIPNSVPKVEQLIPPKEKRLLWLGRIETNQKRADLILPVWERVSQSLPDWELDVVGDGTLLEELRAKAVERGLPRVNFYGRQVADRYYRRSAIFFMTSAFEGFPNTLVEAQSFGAIPVIFDSYPVARWIVEDGVSGALIPPSDIATMASRIVEIANSTQREQFSQAALESARRFEIDRVGRTWQGLFESEVPRFCQSNDHRESPVDNA